MIESTSGPDESMRMNELRDVSIRQSPLAALTDYHVKCILERTYLFTMRAITLKYINKGMNTKLLFYLLFVSQRQLLFYSKHNSNTAFQNQNKPAFFPADYFFCSTTRLLLFRLSSPFVSLSSRSPHDV